eukprot:g78687.t1
MDNCQILRQALSCGLLVIRDQVQAVMVGRIEDECELTVSKGGPLFVKGPFTLKKPDGTEEALKNKYFCRCGATGTSPFCDGSHKKAGFDS